MLAGTGSGPCWVVSQPYGKVALGFLAYFYACLVDFFFRFFSPIFMGCGGSFNIRGQKRRPRLRPKLTRLPALPAHFARLCALYGHNQTAAVHAALCAAVCATILQWICMNAA